MNHEVKKLSPFRLLSMYVYETLGTGHNMYAQIEVDVTNIRQSLRLKRKAGNSVSFFGFMLSLIAKTINENNIFNQIRCGNKLYNFNEVDIDTAIELEHENVLIPHKYIVRNAAKKSNEEITKEIENAKERWKVTGFTSMEDKSALQWIKLTSGLPKWLIKIIIRKFAKSPQKIKNNFGTTYVTCVSNFTNISGFIIPFFEGKNRPLAIVFGGVYKKSAVVNSELKIRDYISMTISINHDIIDGAPAARFVNRLKQNIERGI